MRFRVSARNDKNIEMRKFKDLRLNEKLLLLSAVILIIALVLKWSQVKDGFFKGWERFESTNTEKLAE